MKVFERNGIMYADSREAAELLEIRHGNLIMLIQKLVKNNAELQKEFQTEMKNDKVFCICITEKGCKVVADFKMNNAKSNKTATKQFVLAYQEAFSQMQTFENNMENQAADIQTENSGTEVDSMILAKSDTNQVVTINSIEVHIKEYNNQRVVTFRDIDSVHCRPEGTAKRNFNANRKHLIEGEDFFELNQPDEIRTLGLVRPQGGTFEKVILITESGYYMLVKSFTDDLSWNVQRELKKGYFTARQMMQNIPDSYMIDDPEERALRWLQEYREKKKLLSQVEEQKKQIAEQTEQITAMTPKAEYCDEILDAEGLMTVTEIAKDYGKSARWLNQFLHEKGVQFKQNGIWHLYQKYAVRGYAMTKTTAKPDKNGIMREHTNTYWNQRGRMFIHELLKANGIFSVAEMKENQGQLVLANQ